ncbi:MAG: hypothetical protein JSR97_10175 [Verrucomicrobia bacterium]|nr:hypothetical protein [Verrucomicrobiota bacterium]
MKTGIERLVEDLTELNFSVSKIKDSNNQEYAVINGFEIPAGTFVGRIINLAIPAPPDYPRSFGPSIHINQHLVPFGNIPNVRNVINSALGNDWQYWSFRFNVKPSNPTSELLTQINAIFRKN